MKNKKIPKPRLPKRTSDVFTAVKASDTKISQTAMHLEYLFDRGVNFKDRAITITGDIDQPWFDIVDAAMSEFERDSKKAVKIKINSSGGSVYEALAIVGRLRNSKCHVITEGYGHVMSAATIILACGDKRRMSEFATFMHHEASYEAAGRHSQVVAEVNQREREEKLWSKWMAEFCRGDENNWYEIGKHTDKYYTAEECVEMDIVDEVF